MKKGILIVLIIFVLLVTGIGIYYFADFNEKIENPQEILIKENIGGELDFFMAVPSDCSIIRDIDCSSYSAVYYVSEEFMKYSSDPFSVSVEIHKSSLKNDEFVEAVSKFSNDRGLDVEKKLIEGNQLFILTSGGDRTNNYIVVWYNKNAIFTIITGVWATPSNVFNDYRPMKKLISAYLKKYPSNLI